jgi:hypothetical protein
MSPCSLIQLPSQSSVCYATVVFRLSPTPLLKCPSFRGSTYNIILVWSLTTTSFAQCKNGMAGHQLLPEPTIALGPVLWLLEAPCGYMPVPILILQCSDRFHRGLSFRDTLLLCYCLQLSGVHFIQPFWNDSQRGIHFL